MDGVALSGMVMVATRVTCSTSFRLLRCIIFSGRMSAAGSDSATELRKCHGGTCFDCGRRQGVARPSTVGHITPATGAPQRPDATADRGGACTGPSCRHFGDDAEDSATQNSGLFATGIAKNCWLFSAQASSSIGR